MLRNSSPNTAINDILPLLEKSDELVCSSAIEELSKHNVREARVIAAYVAVLGRDDLLGRPRQAALVALGKLGNAAVSATHAVQGLLESDGLSDYDRKLFH